MQECTTAPARAEKARAPVKPEPIEAVAPEPVPSPYDAIADMGRQIEEGFRMLVDDTLVSDSSPLDVTIDFIRRHIREALWNFASPDIHTVNDGPIAWHDQMTMAFDPMPDVLNIVLVAARQSKSPMAIKVLENLKGLIEAMNLALTHWDEETLALAFREVTEDERPAATAPAVAAPSPDPFRCGMDLALRMLREAKGIADAEDYSTDPKRWARKSAPQNRFAFGYLHTLADAPRLIDGFSAALSAYLADSMREDSRLNIDHFLCIPAAEYQPGRPGDDGTEPDDDAPEPAQAAAAPPRGRSWRQKVVYLLSEVKQRLAQAGDELSFVQPLGGAVQSASSLAKFLAQDIEAALDQDPGPKWLEMLQEQDAELDGLCRLVDVLQGLAASRKGRQGFGALSEAFQLAQAAAATFDAVVDDLPGRRSPAEPVAAPAPSEWAAPEPITWETDMGSRCPAASAIAERAAWDMGLVLSSAAQALREMPLTDAESDRAAHSLGMCIRRLTELREVIVSFLNAGYGLSLGEAFDAVQWSGQPGALHGEYARGPELDSTGAFIGRVNYA